MEKRTLILMSSCAGFLALGMLTGGIGPALAELAHNTGSSLSAAGGLFTALFFGALLAQPVAGAVYDRFGAKPVLLTGLLFMGLGTLACTASPSLTLVLLAGVITGIGHGSVDISTTVNVSGMYVEKRTPALNLVNVFFGTGAVIAPAISGFTLAQWDTALPGLWLGALLALSQVPVMLVLLRVKPKPEHASSASGGGLYRVPLLWLFALFILIYVGTENGVGGWTSTYVVATAVMTAEQGALLTSGFWLMLTIGRLIATFFSHHTTPQRVLWLCVVGALAGALVMLIGVNHLIFTAAATLLIGLSVGPIFPTALSIVTEYFAAAPGRAAAVVMACASIGGASIPYYHGVILEQISPTASVVYVVVLAVVMMVLMALTGRALAGKRKIASGF